MGLCSPTLQKKRQILFTRVCFLFPPKYKNLGGATQRQFHMLGSMLRKGVTLMIGEQILFKWFPVLSLQKTEGEPH